MEKLNLETYLNSDTDPQSQGRIRILFIALNVQGYYSLAIRILTLLVARSESLRNGYHPCFLEQNVDSGLDSLINKVALWNPKIVGLSVNIWNRNAMFDLARALKKRWPEMVILAGGQEMTQSVIDYLDSVPEIDFIVDGEGELPTQQFLENLDRDEMCPKDPLAVTGLRFRHGGKTCFSGPAQLVSSLDHIPSPILAGLVPFGPEQKLGVMLEGSRGCPFRCSFCFEGAKRSAVRSASLDRIIEEFKYVFDRGGRLFHMLDPILCNTNPDRLGRLTAKIREIATGKGRFTVSVEAYAENITPEVAENLRTFSIIDIGLQSVNPNTLNAIHRHYAPQRYSRGLASMRERGALFNLYLICGLPYETLGSYFKGVAYILEQRPTRIYLNELCLLNGTELRRNADQYGYQFEADPPYLVHGSNWMSPTEFRLAWSASKYIEHRYNLSAQGIFGNLPWLDASRRTVERHFNFSMSGGCSWNCQRCKRGSTNDFTSPLASELADVENADIEIRAADCVDRDEMLRLIGRLHLGGAARIILSAPPDLFTDPQFVSLLIQRGVWHFNTFHGVPNQRLDQRPNFEGSPIDPALENLTQAVRLKGAAILNACVDVAIFPNGTHEGALKKTIDQLTSHRVSVITIAGDILDQFPDGRQTIADYFLETRNPRTWLRAPRDVIRSVFQTIPDVDGVVDWLSRLNGLSPARGEPPCLIPNLGTASTNLAD